MKVTGILLDTRTILTLSTSRVCFFRFLSPALVGTGTVACVVLPSPREPHARDPVGCVPGAPRAQCPPHWLQPSGLPAGPRL